MKKKLLSIVLSLCMILTLLPTFALAEGTTATAITNAEGLRNALTTGGSYTLSNDITLGDWASVTVSSDFTLDGNGHTLSGMNVTEAAGTGNSGTSGSDYSLYHAGLIGNANANVTLSNLKVSGATVAPSKVTGAPNDYVYKNGLSSAAVLIGTSSGGKTIALNNVSVTNSTVAGVTKLGVFVGQNNSTLNITNCEISGCTVTGEYNYAPVAGYTAKTAVITASGLTLSGNSMTFQKVDTDFQAYISADGTSNVVTPAYAVETENKRLWATSSDYYVIDDGSTASTVTGYTDGYTMKRVAVTVADSFVCSIGNTYYPTLAEAAAAATSGDTIKLLANVTENITIPSGKTMTLDLNGKTLTGVTDADVAHNNSAEYKAVITNKGTLTVVDTASGGAITDASPYFKKATIYNTQSSTLNLLGGTVSKGTSGAYYVLLNHGTATINGATVQSADTETSAILNGYSTSAWETIPTDSNTKIATMTISSGTVTGGRYAVKNGEAYARLNITGGTFSKGASDAAAIINYSNCEATISGGTFAADGAKDVISCKARTNANGAGTTGLSVTGGSFSGSISVADGQKLSVSGGYFTSDPSAYVADGYYTATSDKAGYALMVKSGYAASITKDSVTTNYATLAAAVAAAANGDTVKLLANVTLGGTTTERNVYNLSNVTLDLNQKTISAANFTNIFVGSNAKIMNGSMVCLNGGSYALFIGEDNYITNGFSVDGVKTTGGVNIYNAENVTLKNMDIAGATSDVKGTNYYAVWLDEGAFATIESGTYSTASYKATSLLGATVAKTENIKSVLTVKGGSFTVNSDDSLFLDSAGGTLTVQGGYFTTDPSAYVVSSKIVGTSDKTGYTYMVKAVEANVKVDVGNTVANPVPSDAPVMTSDDKTALEAVTVAPDTNDKGLSAAGGNVASTVTTQDETAAKTALDNAGVTTTGETVAVVVQPKLVVTPQSYVSADKELTLDIKAVYDEIATTNPNAINTEGDGQNAVVTKENQPMTVPDGTPVVIKVAIPAAMATEVTPTTTPATYKSLNIKHVKESGAVYYYTANVTKEAEVYYATFTVTHGFSTFTLQAADTRTLAVDYDSSLDKNYFITDVGTTLPVPTKAGYTFTGWKFNGLDGVYTKLTNDLWTTVMTGVVGANTAKYIQATAQFSAIIVGGGSAGGGSTTDKYTLSFETNGGSAVKAVTAEKNAVIDLTKYAPTKEGYDFSGWYSDSKLTTAVTSVTMTKDITVYAKWTEKSQTAKLPFTDVPETAYYRDAVAWAVEKDVTSGATATTFAPDRVCTRAETVTFLWRAMGSPEPAAANNPFTDVSANDYYYKAVLWAVEKGITKGASDTTFSPAAPVTRAQTVTFLWRAAGMLAQSGSNPFTDVQTGAFYTDAVLWAGSEGITEGTGTTTFSPNLGCTRAQIVTFLYRDLGK